jgi:thioesterase domain-containing protein/acyl carrier protein
MPLCGVIHAAGVLADGVLADMTLEQMDRAMLPKVQGSWNLHTATRDASLDFFVLFSSVAAVLGSPGQGNYAAGNAALDALAHARRAAGLRATSINWGPWADSGMAAEQGRDDAVQSRGMRLIPPERGLEILDKLLRANVAQVAVMDVHWADLLRTLGARQPLLLKDLAAEVAAAGGVDSGSRVDVEFRNRLQAADGESRRAMVCDYIQHELARIMGVAPESLEADRPLSTFGLDSLLALELKNNLEGRLDFTLPMAKLMEGPSIASLAEATVELVVGQSPVQATGDESGAETWQPLVALRSAGTRPPLVLAPALGGDIRCYDDLTAAMGEDQPVYAFRPRGIDQDLPPHNTMAEMVEDYAAALRRLQPEGPYYLAGWSTGGIYAFALADALEQSGEEVALLALFGAPLPSICDDVDFEDDARFLCDLVNFANCFTGTKMRVEYDELLKLAPADRFQAALAEARRQGTVPANTPESHIRRLVNVGEANVRAIQSYDVKPLRMTARLFIPTKHGGLTEISGRTWDESGDHGWGREVGQAVELHEVPGDHFTMMLGEGAKEIARQIEAFLAVQNAFP